MKFSPFNRAMLQGQQLECVYQAFRVGRIMGKFANRLKGE